MMPMLVPISVQVDRAMKDPVSRHSSTVALAAKRKRRFKGYVCLFLAMFAIALVWIMLVIVTLVICQLEPGFVSWQRGD